jgi:hypothetical protein
MFKIFFEKYRKHWLDAVVLSALADTVVDDEA